MFCGIASRNPDGSHVTPIGSFLPTDKGKGVAVEPDVPIWMGAMTPDLELGTVLGAGIRPHAVAELLGVDEEVIALMAVGHPAFAGSEAATEPPVRRLQMRHWSPSSTCIWVSPMRPWYPETRLRTRRCNPCLAQNVRPLGQGEL